MLVKSNLIIFKMKYSSSIKNFKIILKDLLKKIKFLQGTKRNFQKYMPTNYKDFCAAHYQFL